MVSSGFVVLADSELVAEAIICFDFHKMGWWFWLILLATGVGAFVWEGKKAKERSNLKNNIRSIMVKNKKIWIIAIVLALAIPELILAFFYYAAATQDKFENIDRSNFYRSPEGEIYAAIAHSGRYLLKGADKDSFRVLNLPHNYYYSNVAADKNNVYCSTKILQGLDPKSTHLLGNGYLTDGKTSYFCSPKGEKQPRFNEFVAVMKSVANLFIKSYEDSSYFYKNVRVDSVNLEPIFDMGFARDGETLYYKGGKLDANASGLKFIKTTKGQKTDYFTDGKSVFLDGVKLDVSYTEEMREIATEPYQETRYLFEPKTGAVFANGHKFSEQAMPFAPIYNEGEPYIYWPIFVGKEDKFYIRFLLITLLAFSFHQVSLPIVCIGILLSLLLRIKISLIKFKWLSIVILIVFILIAKFALADFLVSVSSRVETYSNSAEYSEDIGIFRLPNIKAFLTFLFILFFMNKDLYENKLFAIFFLLFTIGVAFRIGFSEFSILSGRFATAFSFSEIFILPFIFNRFKHFNNVLLALFVITQAIATYMFQASFVLEDYFKPLI